MIKVHMILKAQYDSNQRIHHSALLMHSAEQMYALVNDVVSYPQFLTGCAKVEVLDASSQHMLVCMHLARAGFGYHLVTRNTLQLGRRIDLQLHEGPFKFLRGSWIFSPLRADASKVDMELEFAMSSKLQGKAMGVLFNQVAVTMVDAFCKRADQIYV
jgi:ribosome-associated toxin RatA of RatAB toxin-antitoxin module